MASSVQSIGDSHPSFEADSTERVHTIIGKPGGRVNNVGKEDESVGGAAQTVFINPNGGTVNASDGGVNSVPIPVGGYYDLDDTCQSYSLKTAIGNTYIVHTKKR